MQLTSNFNSIEFDSKDGSVMPVDVQVNIELLAKNLQVLRDYLNESVHVNSGYRSPKHNKSIGGVDDSFHIKGMAADITVKSKTPKQLYRIIKKLIKQGLMTQGGIGLYNGFVHYDIRGYAARWDNSSLFNF